MREEEEEEEVEEEEVGMSSTENLPSFSPSEVSRSEVKNGSEI